MPKLTTGQETLPHQVNLHVVFIHLFLPQKKMKWLPKTSHSSIHPPKMTAPILQLRETYPIVYLDLTLRQAAKLIACYQMIRNHHPLQLESPGLQYPQLLNKREKDREEMAHHHLVDLRLFDQTQVSPI